MESATRGLRPMLRWTVLLAGALGSACIGGQTGGEDAVPPTLPFPGGSANRACLVQETPAVLASIEEVSPAGFSAASVLRYAERSFEAPLAFNRVLDEGDRSAPLVIEPAGDEPLAIEIRYAGGELRYFAPTDDGSSFGPCSRGRLDIDVEITLRTPSGALDESVDAVLMARSELEASLWLRFHTPAVEPDPRPRQMVYSIPVPPVQRLAGELSVTAMGRDGRLAFLELWLTLSELGVIGQLDGWLYHRGLLLMRGLATIGETCDDGYRYPLELEEPPVPGAMAPSAQDVLERLREVRIDAVHDDGTRMPLALDLEYREDSACARPGDDTPLTFEAVLPIAADLGGAAIDARWPLELRAGVASDGTLARVHATLAEPGDVSLESSEFERLQDDWGVTGLELAGYDAAGMTLDLMLAFDTEPPGVTGELLIRGYVVPSDRPVSSADGDVLGHLRFEAAPSP